MLPTGLCARLPTATSRKESTKVEERYTGKPLNIIGRKLIRYDASGVTLFTNYYVCDVPFCMASVARMLLQDFCAVLTKDSMKLLTPQHDSVDITRHGTLLYLAPDIVPYHPDMKIVEEQLDQYMSTLDIDMSKVPELPTGVDAVEQLKSLINALKPTYSHTDVWQLDEANHTLTRVHKRPRRAFFTPERSDCPVPLDRLNGQRAIYLDYGEGNEVQDNFMTTELPNQMMDGYWKGRTVFQLKTVPICRYHSKAPPDSTAVPKEEPEHTEAQSSTVQNPVRNSPGSPDLSTDLSTDRGRTLNQKLMTFRDFDDTEFHKVLLQLFKTPETETGELRTSDCWIHTAWIRFHHEPRRTLYVPDETELPHDQLGSYRLTLFYKTSTDQDGKSFVDQWNTDDSRDVGFIWTGQTLFQTSDC